MNLKFGIDDRPRFGQLMLYSLQWFVLAIAVVTTSLFIAVGPPAERVLYAQKVFALMGITTILQVFWGHRLPIVVGPAAVLLVGIITALASQGAETDTGKIYTSLIVGGAIVTLVAAGRLLERIQRIFTPRIVVVILMLIAFTLSPTIRNLIFPAGEEERYAFGLWFTLIGVFSMAVASHAARGVWKSVVIPAALVIGSIVYYTIYGGFGEVFASYTESEGPLLLPHLKFDGGMIAAFIFCYVALLINDIGSIQSLGAMLETPDTDKRCRRGIGITVMRLALCPPATGHRAHGLRFCPPTHSAPVGHTQHRDRRHPAIPHGDAARSRPADDGRHGLDALLRRLPCSRAAVDDGAALLIHTHASCTFNTAPDHRQRLRDGRHHGDNSRASGIPRTRRKYKIKGANTAKA